MRSTKMRSMKMSITDLTVVMYDNCLHCFVLCQCILLCLLLCAIHLISTFKFVFACWNISIEHTRYLHVGSI